MKNLLLSTLFFWLILPHLSAQTSNIDTDQSDKDNKDYILKYEPVVVKKLTVNIVIDTLGFFDVEENYEVIFNDSRRGILRFLKLKYLLDVKDIESQNENSFSDWMMYIFFPEVTTRTIEISNIEVPDRTFDVSGNHPFSYEVKIKIGDEDVDLDGVQNYTIRYRVKNAFLFRESSVDFYWNFLGGNWDMPFLDVDFNVRLQGNVLLDSNSCYLYGGAIGNTNSLPGISFSDSLVSGSSPFLLDKNEDLTLLLHLPENYVPRPTKAAIFWSRYAWPIFPVFCVLTFILVWYKIGRDKRLVKQVQYHPPKNIDPAMAGFLMDSKSNNRDLVALLPYWAAKGLITMEELDVPTFFAGWFRKLVVWIFVFTNIASVAAFLYFLSIESEISFYFIGYFMLLFIFSAHIIVALKRFSKVPRDMDFIKLNDLNDDAKDYERTIFNGIFRGEKRVSLSDLKNTFYTSLNSAKADLKEEGLKHGFTKNSERNVNRTQVILIFTILIGGFALFYFYHLAAALTHAAICFILISKSNIMDKRTTKGDELVKDVMGFYTFVDKAERPKLEFLLKEDPRYYEKTIAYAVAFGMAEKWCKKFEGLTTDPDWYKNRNNRRENFAESLSGMVSRATVTMSSGSSSSGSSSGGGSSGGGFGGGGGSSW